MESEGQSVRIEVCQKCYEHAVIDPHSELIFEQAFSEMKSLCQSINLKILKNQPYRYLRKLKDSKQSTKRYLNSTDNKIVEFPRRSAFQIYYLNVLVYSRLRTMQMPNYKIIKTIMIKLSKLHKADPLLTGLGIFRELQLQWKPTSDKLDCLYQYLKYYTKQNFTQQGVNQAFNKIVASNNRLQLETQRNKVIHPYSLYATKQKKSKMKSIYCPNKYNTLRIRSSITNRNIVSKVGTYIHTKNHNKSRQQSDEGTNDKKGIKLFDLVRTGGQKIININKFKNCVKNQDLKTFTSQSKHIYFSYLDTIKQNRIRQIKTAKTRQQHKRLYSATCSKASTRKQSYKNSFKGSITLRKSEISNANTLNKMDNIVSADSETVKIDLRDSELQWKSQLSQLKLNKKQSNRSNSPNKKNSGKSSPLSSDRNRADMSQFSQKTNRQLISQKIDNSLKQPSPSLTQLKAATQQIPDNQMIRIKMKSRGISSNNDNGSTAIAAVGDYCNNMMIQKQTHEKWLQQQNNNINHRQSATVTNRFSCPDNFDMRLVDTVFQNYCQVSCSQQQKNKNRQLNHKHVQFQITGEQLTSRTVVKSLRELYAPQQLRIFPDIFKEVQNYSSNLSQLVNMLLRSNPMTISRMFENKKAANPYGLYCLWLKNLWGVYMPVFVDDKFLIFQHDYQNTVQSNCRSHYKFCYAQLCNQNSIWFMLLEKAVAKVLGGYHHIAAASLSTLINIVLGYPTVDFSNLTLQRAPKIFEEKNFFNKMAAFYAIMHLGNKNEAKIDRIVNFQYNQTYPRQSKIRLRSEERTKQLLLHQFLAQYRQLTLSIFNSFYYLNQVSFESSSKGILAKKQKSQILSCRLFNSSHKNNCYLMFNFGKIIFTKPCKVSIYKYLNDQQAGIVDGMNPLSQQRRRYEYVGQIKKSGDFFFETELTFGEFICIVQGNFSSNDAYSCPNLTIFSEKQVDIIKKQFYLEPKQQNKNKKKSSSKNSSSKNNLNMRKRTPQILIQASRGVQNNCLANKSKPKPTNNLKFRKHFVADRDSSPSQAQDKQNKQIIQMY